MFVDLKAARFNPRLFRKHIVTPELHQNWKKTTENKLNFLKFRSIWDEIASAIKNGVYEERDGVRLTGLGDMYIGYVPGKKRPVNYKLSKEFGKRIYHENWHSDGKIGKIIYAANGRPYIYRQWFMWAFRPVRKFQRAANVSMINYPDRYKLSQERLSKYIQYDDSRRNYLSDQAGTETS